MQVTWEIMTALITVIGSLIALGSVLAKLIRVLTRLEDAIKSLEEKLALSEHNAEQINKEFDRRINQHEVRLCRIEAEKDIKKTPA